MKLQSYTKIILVLTALLAACGDDDVMIPMCSDDTGCEAGEMCMESMCVPAACMDGELSEGESDVDCGGSCVPCALGRSCGDASDCASMTCTAGVCVTEEVPVTCTDGIANGDETDVDCGGPTCDACADGGNCSVRTDCESGVCASGICAVASCDDDVSNGDETGIDCGGSCDTCAVGEGCATGADCVSGVCADDLCVSAECGDGLLNGDESDVDCGGSCGGCADGADCDVAADCSSASCVDETCAAPTCDDGARNGDESDVDCGGSCDACVTGGACGTSDDCVSLVCDVGMCVGAGCDDGIQNGDETDRDCGGSCSACAADAMCASPADCTSGVCTGALCQAPSCSDAVRNGDETDVDCGGSCGACSVGGMCSDGVDCLSLVCTAMRCVAEGCDDLVMNGDETDVDCGGSCSACADASMCGDATDCTSGVCTGDLCQAPSCSDTVRNGSETDVDCGGSCGACADTSTCSVAGDCTSGVCLSGSCRAPACDDTVLNGDETDLDCGGSCSGCATSRMCDDASDCVSGVCTGGACVAPSCSDTVRNGTETDVDCGGSCGACPAASMCGVGGDCTSGVCTGGVCQAPTCSDTVRNGTETDVDCGGSCSGCAATSMCAGAGDCTSGVCTGGVCQAASCTDAIRNGTETDTDCGGSCPDCGRGDSCSVDGDCSTDGCRSGLCVVGPTASFSLSATGGPAPLMSTATSTATAGDAAISMTRYDFGEGAGFAAATSHTYTMAGMYTVRQRVTDANGFTDTTMLSVMVTAAPALCQLSTTDRSADPGMVILPDGLSIEWNRLNQGSVRSDCSVGPMAPNVYYFEVTRRPQDCTPSEAPEACVPTPIDLLSAGVATSAETLGTSPGETAQSFGVSTAGSIFYNGLYQGGVPSDSTQTFGYIVDYRGASPTVHLVSAEYGAPAIVHTQSLAVTTPLHAMITGSRRKVGIEIRANFGGDVRRYPFEFDPDAILTAAGMSGTAADLIVGFPAPSASAPNTAPTISASADTSVALGSPVTVTATASDAEDGTLTGTILWENMAAPYNTPERELGTGGSVTYTPTQLGTHPLRATVYDSRGDRRQTSVLVTVTGALTQYSDVRLTTADPRAGSGVDLSPDGRRARWTIADKMGVRANQGLLDGFQYFEVHREGAPTNQGGGLVIWEGDLDPYSADNVPPSMSVNTLTGIWQNIIYLGYYDSSLYDTYGFAVDYRGMNPVVYVIINDEVYAQWEMYDVFVPVHPMLYGNSIGTAPGTYDEGVFFGDSALPNNGFDLNVTAALLAWGVPMADVAALQLCWGDMNTDC